MPEKGKDGTKEEPAKGTEIVYVERIPLEATAKANPLVAVGFSPKLPQLLQNLNNSLVEFGRDARLPLEQSPIEFCEMTFYPDPQYPISPLLRTEFQEHKKVIIRVFPPKKESVNKDASPGAVMVGIGEEESPLGSKAMLSILSLKELQSLIKELAPGKRVKLVNVELGSDPMEKISPPLDFLALTQMEFELEMLKKHVFFGLVIEGQPRPTFAMRPFSVGHNDDLKCALSQFRLYCDNGQEAERVIELVTNALSFQKSASANKSASTKPAAHYYVSVEGVGELDESWSMFGRSIELKGADKDHNIGLITMTPNSAIIFDTKSVRRFKAMVKGDESDVREFFTTLNQILKGVEVYEVTEGSGIPSLVGVNPDMIENDESQQRQLDIRVGYWGQGLNDIERIAGECLTNFKRSPPKNESSTD